MIAEITYRSFKSLRDLTLPLGQINVFIGANGSGKSNLLEGLGVLGAAAYGRVDDEALLRRGVRPGVPRLYKTAFPGAGQGTETDILFEAKGANGAEYQVTLWNPIEKPNPAWKFKTERLEFTGERIVTRHPAETKKRNPEQGYAALKLVDLEPSNPASILMNDLRNYSIYSANTPTLRGLIQDQQTREPVGLSGGRLPEAIDELVSEAKQDDALRDALDEARDLVDWASDFSAAPSLDVPLSPSAARSRLVVQFVDRFMAKKRNKLTGYDASEGALYVLFAAVLALHSRTPLCLAVDNVDQALNPLLAKKVVGAICRWTIGRNNRQWLITAHNPAVLDALPLQNPEVRLFAVDRDNNGQTRIKRIEINAELLRYAEQDWTLSRLWMNGILGGVPNV
jgi:predicted ATPase